MPDFVKTYNIKTPLIDSDGTEIEGVWVGWGYFFLTSKSVPGVKIVKLRVL